MSRVAAISPAALTFAVAGAAGLGLAATLGFSQLPFYKWKLWLSMKRGHQDLKFHERDLLEYVVAHSKLGDPVSVFDTIDSFCYKFGWAMNTGDKKGAIVDKVMLDKMPQLVLELGGYVGYSAVRFGHQQVQSLASSPGKHPLYLSVELDPLMAAISTKLIEHAGLESSVKVLIGTLSTTEERIRAAVAKHLGSGEACPFDLIYIDHWKDQYVPDFLRLEEIGFIGPGTTVVADNIIYPGAPEYLRLLTEDKKEEYDSDLVESTLEYSDKRDALLISVKK